MDAIKSKLAKKLLADPVASKEMTERLIQIDYLSQRGINLDSYCIKDSKGNYYKISKVGPSTTVIN